MLLKVALSDSTLQAGHLNTLIYEIHLLFQILLAEEGWWKNSETEVAPEGAVTWRLKFYVLHYLINHDVSVATFTIVVIFQGHCGNGHYEYPSYTMSTLPTMVVSVPSVRGNWLQ